MALNRWRRRFEGNERVDLPDFRTMLSRVYADFTLLIQQYIDNEAVPRVVKRYQEGTHDVNVFKLRKDVNRALQDFNQEWLYVNTDAASSTEDLAVLSNTTNYVEVKIAFVNDDLQTRAFWDTDIGLTGQEFFDEINVRTRIDEEFSVNDTGFQGGEWIPLYEVDVDAGGVITDTRRADDLLWKPREILLPDATTRADVFESSVKDLRSFIDFMGAIMSEVKGTDLLIEDAAWSNLKLLREYQNIFFSGGGSVSFADPNANEIAWSTDFLVSIAGRSDIFTIPAGAEIIQEDECVYVDIPEAIVAPVDEVQTASQDSVPDSGDIVLNHDGNLTAAIPFGASNTDIQNALNALASLSAVTVTGDFLNQNVVVTFAGADGGQDQPLITVDTNNLLNGATPVAFSFVETTKGVSEITNTLTPVVGPLADMPIDPKEAGHSPRALVLFYRKNNQVQGGMRIPILDAGETGTVGSDLPANIRTRLGIVSETAFEAYSGLGGGLIDANDSYANSIGKLANAAASGASLSNQDRNLKLIKGGNWAFNIGAGAPTTDVSFSGPDDQGTLLFDSDRWGGSSYEAGVAGDLASVTMRIRKTGSPTGDIFLGIYADNGSGEPGALLGVSDNIDSASLTASLANITFPISASIPQVIGTTYHAILRTDNMTLNDISNTIVIQNTNADTEGTAARVFTTDGGASWSVDGALDLSFFETVVTAAASGSLSWDADAFLQIPGLADARNTIPTSASPINLADGEVAYVSVNRVAGAAANLSLTIEPVASVTLDDNKTVIARRCGSDVLIGDDQTIKLSDGESQSLDSGLSNQTLEALGGSTLPVTESTSDPRWGDRGSPLYSLRATDRTFGAIAQMDAQLAKLFGQLQITAHETDNDKVRISGADQVLRDNRILSQEINNLIAQFEGAVLNFTTGNVRNVADDTTIGTFTFDAIPANEYTWMGVALVPSGLSADGRLALEMLVTPTNDFNADDTLALKPAIAGSKKSGAVQIFNNAGNLEVFKIRQLGTGSGSGSGTGDANSFLEDLQNRIRRTCFKFFTSNIFSSRQETLTDAGNTTATFDVANLVYDFTAGQVLRTISLLTPRFLGTSSTIFPEADQDLARAEIRMLFAEGAVDPAPVVRVSRDGVEFQTTTPKRVGLSGKYVLDHIFTEEALTQVTHEYAVANADDTHTFRDTGVSQAVAIPIVITEKEVQKDLTLYFNKVGAAIGNAYVRFVKDDSGAPSLDVADQIGSEKRIDIEALSAGDQVISFDFGRLVTKPGTYWVRIVTDDTYKTNFTDGVDEFNLRVDSSSPTDPEAASFNGTVWAPISGVSGVYLLEGSVLGLFVEIEASQNDVSLEAMAVMYGNRAGVSTANQDLIHTERFDQSLNLNVFNIPPSKFLPDTRMKIYDISEGNVYSYPAFQLDGQRVTFPEGTFNGPAGIDVQLEFNMNIGGGFDNSDQNAALLAANRLGSTDPNIDRSAAGEGILLRADDTKLIEVSVAAKTGGGYELDFSEVN